MSELEEPTERTRWEWTASATPRSGGPAIVDETTLRILRDHGITVDPDEVEPISLPDGDRGRVVFTVTTETEIVGLEELIVLAARTWKDRELPDRRDLPEELRDAEAWLIDVEWPQDGHRVEA